MMNTYICVSQGANCNSLQFTGKVDSSVNKYVKVLKREAKEMYVRDCKNRGINQNPTAFRCIDERCNSALAQLNRKAELMHEDTVIKVETNPRKKDSGSYLCVENKHLLQEWEQKGAADAVSVYKNNLREANGINQNSYDRYISRFEGLVSWVNPKKLDAKMVRTSISNLWNLSIPKITRGNFAEKYTNSTKKVAQEIGYENNTFADSLKARFAEVREQFAPKKNGSQPTLWDKIMNFFN